MRGGRDRGCGLSSWATGVRRIARGLRPRALSLEGGHRIYKLAGSGLHALTSHAVSALRSSPA